MKKVQHVKAQINQQLNTSFHSGAGSYRQRNKDLLNLVKEAYALANENRQHIHKLD